jgi:hypothetical protein
MTTTITAPACDCWHYRVRLHDGHCCFTDDSTCHPVPEDMRAEVLTALRAAWDEPFLASPSDTAASARRATLTRYLADVILSSPLLATAGGMTGIPGRRPVLQGGVSPADSLTVVKRGHGSISA